MYVCHVYTYTSNKATKSMTMVTHDILYGQPLYTSIVRSVCSPTFKYRQRVHYDFSRGSAQIDGSLRGQIYNLAYKSLGLGRGCGCSHGVGTLMLYGKGFWTLPPVSVWECCEGISLRNAVVCHVRWGDFVVQWSFFLWFCAEGVQTLTKYT